ncbi:hypothetical protein FOB22_004630 [Saccharomyces cerevisiae]|nr:hypothetical protein FOB22_004630 [Saccharomyces cerevisiae]
MARKLKGKIGSKGLKGALLRHQAKVKLVRNIESKQKHELRKKNSSANNKTVKRNQEFQKLNQGKVMPFEKDETLMLCGEEIFLLPDPLLNKTILKVTLIITSYDNSVNELKLKYPHTLRKITSYDLNEDTPQAKKLTAEGYGNIILSLFDGEPYDSWQIKLLAKKNGLTLSRSSKFQWENFPGYHHRRTNSEQDTTKPAKERDARFYIFSKYVSNSSKHNRKSKKDTDSDSD